MLIVCREGANAKRKGEKIMSIYRSSKKKEKENALRSYDSIRMTHADNTDSDLKFDRKKLLRFLGDRSTKQSANNTKSKLHD